jgi:L-amino acid N-acyltransferase YncA
MPGNLIVARATILRSMRIESATAAHSAAIAAIYDEAARTSPATFDLEGHPPGWWAERIDAGDYPFLVALGDDGAVLGFARGSRHKEKPAYGTTCETSVYVAAAARGRGAGRALYDALLAQLERSPLLLAVAGITEPNPASVALHTSCGFTPVGTFHAVGRKLGRTWDVTWYERSLS